MITPEQEELASLYALGLLEADELARFEAQCAADSSLRELAGQLAHAAAHLAWDAPAMTPPAQVWENLRRELHPAPSMLDTPAPGPRALDPVRPAPRTQWFPWALAAALAICCGVLLFRPAERIPEVASAPSPVPTPAPELSIAVLKGTDDAHKIGDAVVVWDPATQTGILDLARMPRPGDDRDYQLWVVDPQYEKPVDGGVFAVDSSGRGKLTFHPRRPIADAKVFAISLEPRGGSESARGPIVMASR